MSELITAVSGLVFVVAAALIVYLLFPFKYPFKTESDYSHHKSPWWQLYYSHKYLRPKKRAEKGSGLEKYFSGLSFDFSQPSLEDSTPFSIRAVGDLMCRHDLVGRGGDKLWDEVGEYVLSGDLSMGNMEFAVNEDWVVLKLLRFSVTPAHATPLLRDSRFGAFDFVSIANNHINDSLCGGIRSTCDFLDSVPLKYAGASRTREEQDLFPIVDVKGVKIALLAYTFSTNNIPLEKGFEHGVNVVRFNALDDKDYDNSLILRHVKLAKERGAQYIISNHHFGMDLEFYPPERLVQRTHELFEAGIDMVVGHHPHVVNPVDRYQTKDGRDCVAFYSLGNFTSAGLIFPIQQMSQVAGIEMVAGKREDGSFVVTPTKIELTPVFHSMNPGEDGNVLNRALAVNRGVAAIERGEIPSYFSKRDIRLLPKLAREYAKYFNQRGIDYR
jgi:poly-gamma-glutamate capsule biosynthesis protein CapA/YwtB (metallophosphatase superfamily)